MSWIVMISGDDDVNRIGMLLEHFGRGLDDIYIVHSNLTPLLSRETYRNHTVMDMRREGHR